MWVRCAAKRSATFWPLPLDDLDSGDGAVPVGRRPPTDSCTNHAGYVARDHAHGRPLTGVEAGPTSIAGR
ncbi:hypothetical protein A4X20_16280 [Mycolicibacterium iranicum]|uniref:Uncharacterized protein n=1 Tax=Mycolicibacterium iranicum TaxID=912594 RepID=A0A178M011_MYCIR|nr:hypothetical protein A4X20_16280 [Mycolicibacterium iranicum]